MRIIEECKVKLTDEELRLRGLDLAQKVAALRRLEAEKKEALKVWKDRIDEAKKAVIDMSEVVSSGVEARLVECEEIPDLDKGVIRVVRIDTGEEVRSRIMSAAERQELEQGRFPFAIHEGGAGGVTSTEGSSSTTHEPDDEPELKVLRPARRGRKTVEH